MTVGARVAVVLSPVSAARREHPLMSIRERHRQAVRAQGRVLSMLAVALLALFGVAAVFVNGPLQRGIIVGTGVTLTACVVAALVVLTSGSAPLMMGELAEQRTAQELRPLREHSGKLLTAVAVIRVYLVT